MKNTSIFKLFIILNINYCSAQAVIQWQKSYGGSENDFANSIIQTNDGGFIIAGVSASDDSDVTGNNGGRDYWILKINNAGAIQWQKSFGGSTDEFANDIHQTSDGGYILAGYSESNDSDVAGNYGHRDMWIVKIDSVGLIEWQKNYGGSNFEIAYSVQETFDGGYMVGGYSNSTDGDLAGTSSNAQNYWLLKLDQAGLIQWFHLYGGSATDEALSTCQTSDHGYILAGYTYSQNGHVTGYHGNQDAWIVRTDSMGGILWQKALGGTDSESANCIRQTVDGGFIVACTSSSVDGDVNGNHGGSDCWIVKLDSAGNMEWEKSLGGSGADGANSVYQTVEGGYIVCGYSNSNDGDVTSNQGDYDCWIIKLNYLGNIEWQKSLGGNGIDAANSIVQTSDNGFIVASTVYSGNGDITSNHGNSDYWIVKLDSAQNVSINELNGMAIDFQVYPNPFSDETELSFKYYLTDRVKIEIRDREGRVIKKLMTSLSGDKQFQVLWDGIDNSGNRAKDGLYFITLVFGEYAETKGVVLMRN
jgi:hypothetical protein